MSVIDQIQKSVPEDKKQDLFTYIGGGAVTFIGFLNDNPDVLAAWGTFLAGAAVILRLAWDMWKSRK